MYKSQSKHKKLKVSSEPKPRIQAATSSHKAAPKNPTKKPEDSIPTLVPKKAKPSVPGKFMIKHLVKSPFKFITSVIPDEVSEPLFLKFFQTLTSCVPQTPKANTKRVSPEGLVIGLGKTLRILQQHISAPTEFPLPLRLLFIFNKDLVSSTLLYPLTQLISMLEKPGVFGALPLSEPNASKIASCLGLPSVMVVGIKTDAPAFDPFIQHYVESAEIKFMSSESKPWPTSIRPVEYLPLETKQVSIPIPISKSKLPKP